MKESQSSTRPPFLKVRAELSENYRLVSNYLEKEKVKTVCRSANCPNIYQCFEELNVTFLLLGDRCTRSCFFCNISPGLPKAVDKKEIEKIVTLIERIRLKKVILTSVTRDDLSDGGAAHYEETVKAIKAYDGAIEVEALIPDLKIEGLHKIATSGLQVIAHNLETVPRLYKWVRPGADYTSSLNLLKNVSSRYGVKVKSGLMVGLGETYAEIVEVLKELASIPLDELTIGQYLPPSPRHAPPHKLYSLDEFERLKVAVSSSGINKFLIGPLIRSSSPAISKKRDAAV